MPNVKRQRRGVVVQVTGAEGRLGDEIGPIHVYETRRTQVIGAEGKLGDEVGPIYVHPEGDSNKGRMK